ncbi:MAG: hypothetical protein A2074_04130 [Candidatus Aquicultor primus]|uniref:Flagellar motor switch protein FliG n=1 Tax=Candidatus Aquicultor primus TaxID=1797195 RepID=A0A1F2UIS1_9ACTN|nr:MAG: hypothetical protein A2074_04130 [Candidatus Aquicultor primus]
MATSGLQKAAMLLMSVEPGTASELLKGLSPEVVTNIAVEIAYLDASGYSAPVHGYEIVQEFCKSLGTRSDKFEVRKFLGTMLESTVGAKKSQEIQSQLDELLNRKDQFINIRKADTKKIAAALEGEHPNAIAVVLAELPVKKSSEIIAKLDEQVRPRVVRKMAITEPMSVEARNRIAGIVLARMQAAGQAGQATVVETSDTLRNVAVMLRALPKEVREGLLESIKQSDESVATSVRELMIMWEDIPSILDRPLQEALRGVESGQLAKALLKADENIVKKIRGNISERARTLVDEETSLLGTPKKEDIQAGRDTIVGVLREMNEKGELAFVEE